MGSPRVFVTDQVEYDATGEQISRCVDCNERGRPHSVVEEDAGPARFWGGAPSHWRRCTGCGATDGPWVRESDVNAGL